MIEKAVFKKCKKLEESRFAPYAGDTVFIIDRTYLIHDEQIITDFDVAYHKAIFEVEETVD